MRLRVCICRRRQRGGGAGPEQLVCSASGSRRQPRRSRGRPAARQHQQPWPGSRLKHYAHPPQRQGADPARAVPRLIAASRPGPRPAIPPPHQQPTPPHTCMRMLVNMAISSCTCSSLRPLPWATRRLRHGTGTGASMGQGHRCGNQGQRATDPGTAQHTQLCSRLPLADAAGLSQRSCSPARPPLPTAPRRPPPRPASHRPSSLPPPPPPPPHPHMSLISTPPSPANPPARGRLGQQLRLLPLLLGHGLDHGLVLPVPPLHLAQLLVLHLVHACRERGRQRERRCMCDHVCACVWEGEGPIASPSAAVARTHAPVPAPGAPPTIPPSPQPTPAPCTFRRYPQHHPTPVS